MSDTPRTDAVQHGPAAGSFFAMLEHARELERENAKLREALRRIYDLPVSERKWSTAMDIAATALDVV